MTTTTTEKLAIKNLVNFLRAHHRSSISLVDYFEDQQLSPKDRNALLSQIHRSQIIKIEYRKMTSGIKTIISLIQHG